ncbi:MAG: serine/threonine-protein kinase [Betaproteobacteria bacterium]
MAQWSRRVGWSASGSVDLATEEGRAFLQERLALFAQVGFLIDSGFFLASFVALAFSVPHMMTRPPRGAWIHDAIDLANLGLFLVAWLACRRGRRPLWLLRTLDAALVLVFCVLAALPVGMVRDEVAGVRWTALLIVTNALIARAVLVPSSPRRTLLVGLACCVPILAASRGLTIRAPLVEGPPSEVSFLVPAALWCVCGLVLSTVASHVIFGLRRRVSAARRLGQYTLEARLGEGGMGTVYRAHHAMLRRPTAIKLLPPRRAGGQNLQRFEREVQTTALLSHPNTVAIYDYGRTPDGIFYYAMEYLEGIDLEALVRGFGPQPPGRVAHIMMQVAGALGEAHAVGLIHRDVKPGNVVLCSRGGAPDVAKVVDFGLVRDVSGERPATQSALDIITGTPLYLSPEAITSPASVDGRSDLYALGALAYFLLAGRNVFEGATVVEVCTHHLHTPPQPPSRRLGCPLPADLEAIVLECLEKDPQRRPQSAAELLDRLEACACLGEWGEREARAWWKENAARVALLRAKPEQTSASPVPTLAVSLEDRLPGAGGAR